MAKAKAKQKVRVLTERQVAMQHAEARRQVVRGLFARGYSPKYGFNKLAIEVCETQAGIPTNDDQISDAVKAVMVEVQRDPLIRFGKMRVLDILGQQLMEIAQIEPGKNAALAIGKSRQMLEILDRIAELEGFKKPQIQFTQIIGSLPPHVCAAIADAEDDAEVQRVLVANLGMETAYSIMSQIGYQPAAMLAPGEIVYEDEDEDD